MMQSTSIRRRELLKTWAMGGSFHAGMAPAVLQAQSGHSNSGNSRSASSRGRTTVVEDVGRWVAQLKYEELPAAVTAKAKRILLDTLGCAMGAVDAAPVRMAQQVVSIEGGNPHATVVGVGREVSCDQAAFLNGMALRYLDYNDYAALGSPHHCSINVAPALAVAEMQGLTGKDLLLGMAVGYEVQLRFRDATEPGSKNPGWDRGTIATAYSSAAVAAKLLGLDAARIAHAIAIAGAHANTLAEVRGDGLRSGGVMTPSKGTADPMAARTGVFAALLAREGLTYPLTILEGTAGYGKVVAGVLRENVLRERSGDFQILKSCFKMWPCFVYAQAPIAAALEIRRRRMAPEEIEAITVGLTDTGYENQQAFLGEITAREHADHSVPYAVARALLDGDVRVEDFDEKRFRDPHALALIKKVTLRPDSSLTTPDVEGLGAFIEVRFRNGVVERAKVPDPPGSIENPADEKSLMRKFVALSEKIVGKEGSSRAAEIILAVEKISDLKALLSAVSAPSGSRG